MSELDLKIGGISTIKQYADGECLNRMNLRAITGDALVPVPHKEVKYTLQREYDLIFVHSVAGVERYICVDNTSDSSSDVYVFDGTTETLVASTGHVYGMAQTGLVVTMATSEGLRYMTYKEGTEAYEYMGKFISDITFEINYNKYIFTRVCVVDLGSVGTVLTNTPSCLYGRWGTTNYYTNYGPDYNVKIADNQTMHYTGGFGSKYIMYDIPAENRDERIARLKTEMLSYRNIFKETGINMTNGTTTTNYKLKLQYPIFVVIAIRSYDGNYIAASEPILCANHVQGEEVNKLFNTYNDYQANAGLMYTNLQSNGFSPMVTFKTSLDEKYRDTVASVDIFVSEELSMGNMEEWDWEAVYDDYEYQYNMFDQYGSDDNCWDSEGNFRYFTAFGYQEIYAKWDEDTNTKWNKMLRTTSVFYLGKSLTFDEYNSKVNNGSIMIPEDFEDEVWDNITTQPTLSLGTLQNSDFYAKVISQYNSRVHIADLDEEMRFTSWKAQLINDIKISGKVTAGGYGRVVFELVLSSGQKIRYGGTFSKYYQIPPFFYFNDSRANILNIYYSPFGSPDSDYVLYKSMQLRQHDLLPGKFYEVADSSDWTDKLDPIGNRSMMQSFYDNNPTATRYTFTSADIRTLERIRRANILKVSENANPYIFEAAETYTVGNGRILNLATNATTISEGQFGDFPMYVFTDNGIYAMRVDSTGNTLYKNVESPASYDVPINGIVEPTTGGILFISDKGLMLISGRNTKLLTHQLYDYASEVVVQNVLNAKPYVKLERFQKYLETADFMAYDGRENEVIISNRSYPYNYVYQLGNGQMYTSDDLTDIYVRNTFPDLLMMRGNDINDFHVIKEENGLKVKTEVSIITRPIKFGSDLMKNMTELRCPVYLTNTEEMRVTLHASNDMVNFRFVSGIGIDASLNYSNLDMGRMPFNKFRGYVLGMSGKIDYDNVIYPFAVSVNKEYERKTR